MHDECVFGSEKMNKRGQNSNNSPTKVPTKKGKSGTPITGEVMLMNQLGRNGVMRKNII